MQTNTSNATHDAQPLPEIRILKIGNCPSLSGSSTLTYHVAANNESAIAFRVFANTGKGYFSNEWIPLDSILEVFGDRASVGATLLRQAYISASSNNGGFLLGVLRAESLVQVNSAQHGSYLPVDPAAYKAELKVLIDSGIDLKVEEKPRKAESIKPATLIKKARLTLSGIKG